MKRQYDIKSKLEEILNTLSSLNEETKSKIINEIEKIIDFELTVLKLSYAKFITFDEYWNIIKGMSLEQKIDLAHKIIEESIRITKGTSKVIRAHLGFSGGKASTMLLDLLLEHFDQDELIVHFTNTLNEIPESLIYTRKIVKEYFKVKNFIETIPKITPFQIWKKFGFPKESRIKGYLPVCCLLLKEIPAKIVIEKFDCTIDFTGIQFTESLARRVAMMETGLVRRTRWLGHCICLKKFITRAYPIAIFTDHEIWTYLKRRGIPINPAYEKYQISRQGCQLCTNNVLWRENLRKINPRLLKFAEEKMKEWGVQQKTIKLKELEKILNVGNWEKLYEIRIYH